MAAKLTARQQAQLAFLETLPPRFDRVHGLVELMAVQRADDAQVRGLARTLDEIKFGASGLGLSALGDTAGNMATIARRTGGLQARVRALRELLGSLRINYDGAVRAASTPEGENEAGPGS